MTITEFINARLDEEERAAWGLGEWTAKRVDDYDYEIWVIPDPLTHATAPTRAIADVQREDVAEWIAAHSPRRAQRDIDAKRKILAEHFPVTPAHGPSAGEPCCACCGAVDDDPYLATPHPCETLRILAAIWDDHPDYQQEWRPKE